MGGERKYESSFHHHGFYPPNFIVMDSKELIQELEKLETKAFGIQAELKYIVMKIKDEGVKERK